MKILSIETSCDDTGIAILNIKNGKFEVLSNIVASQIEVHKPYGGVYPMMAKREHLKNLPIVLKKSLKQAKIKSPQREINLIAVTNGPGLEPCLWTGINFAKDLSKLWKIPAVPVNHIESHILVNLLSGPVDWSMGPAIALVVSGGHTQIILVKGIGKYKILGETRDDAAGECFDKCAKILGLEYPGGPEIAKLAKKVLGRPTSQFDVGRHLKLPRPMMHTKNYDFSFSGLKTAVLYAWQKKKIKNRQMQIAFSKEIQQAIIDVLIKKTIKAVKDHKAKSLILGGGVSANKELRKQFKKKITEISGFLPRGKKPDRITQRVELFIPPDNLSTDNAVMTAITAYFHATRLRSRASARRRKKVAPSKVATIRANANLRIG